jgi:ATP-dependent Clp protease ATP-binding subunit ClpB
MVARLQMKEVAYRLAERGVALAVTDAALVLILSLSYDPVCEHINVNYLSFIDILHYFLGPAYPMDSDSCSSFVVQQVYGARPIRRWIEKRVVTELSKMLINEEIDENSTVSIDASPNKDELTYKVDMNGGLVNAQTGQKSDILIQVPNGAINGGAAHTVKKMRLMQDDQDDDDMEEERPGNFAT